VRLTPRELIAQLADDRDPRRNASLRPLHERWGLEHAERIVPPRAGAHPLRRPIERTWLLRFRKDIPVAAARDEYAAAPGVVWAAPNHLYPTLSPPKEATPNDPEFRQQWNLTAVGMPRAWAVHRGDPRVVVAVVDTGAALDHEDLRGQLWTNPADVPDNGMDDDGNGYVDDVHGWDFVDAPTLSGKGDFRVRDPDPTDETGHGTHVAGIVAARPNNGIGVAGIAWDCRLMVVRSGFAARAEGTFLQEDDSAAGIVYAVENGAAVANMSWGDEHASLLLRDVVRYALARDVVLVGATGNESRTAVVYPAALPGVIAVAASDQNDDAAYFTNAHAGVDIAAPGIVILSLDLRDGLRTLSGTSMAAPHVAGAAALMRSKRPSLTSSDVVRILKATASGLGNAGRAVGAGRLNVFAALLASEALYATLDMGASRLAADGRLEVRAGVGGPGFAGYRVLYGASAAPTEWTPLVEVRGVPPDLLYSWDTSALPEGDYALRVEVFDGAGRTAHDQAPVIVDHTPPRLLRADVVFALGGGQARPILWLETDDLVEGELTFRRTTDGYAVGPVALGLGRRHALLSVADILPEGEWRYSLRCRNLVGIESVWEGPVSSRPVIPSPHARARLEGRPLPALDVAARLADFNGNGLPELVGATPGQEGFRATQVYEYDGAARFRSVHFYREFFTPLDVGDSNRDGRGEVLGQQGDDVVLLEAGAAGEFPTAEAWRAPRLHHAFFADTDGDGAPEIVGRRDGAKVIVYRAAADPRFAEAAVLVNPTDGPNFLAPTIVVADLDGDGRVEVVVGDSEGELVAFGWRNGAYVPLWQTATPFRAIWALAPVRIAGKTGLLVAAREEVEPGTRDARFLAVALFVWDSASSALRLAGPADAWVQRMLSDDDEPLLAAAPMDPSDRDVVAVVAGGYAYLLSLGRDGFALEWSSPASPSHALATYDITGDGRAEVLFNGLGFLYIVTPSSSPDAASRPFGLRASALDSTRVRLVWEKVAGGPTDIYRGVGADELALLATVNGLEFVDASVRTGITYRYAVEAVGVRSDVVRVPVGEQPRLESAAAPSPLRVVLRFSRPMGPTVRDARLFRVEDEAGAERRPSSVLALGDPKEVVLLWEPALAARAYRLRVVEPERARSDEDMPLDASYTTAVFRVNVVSEVIADLRTLRVYPNPVYPARRHPARVLFDRLPLGAQVRVFSPEGTEVAGGMVDATHGWKWYLLAEHRLHAATGVYLYVVEWNGSRVYGKVAVVR
jgi:subtilisin family serine protease